MGRTASRIAATWWKGARFVGTVARSSWLAAGCHLLGLLGSGQAAGLLGATHGSPVSVPSLDGLPGIGGSGLGGAAASAPTLGSAATGLGQTESNAGTIIGPSLSIPIGSVPVSPGLSLRSTSDPLNLGTRDLSLGSDPGLTVIGRSLGRSLRGPTAVDSPRDGFVLPLRGEQRFVPNEVMLDVASTVSSSALEAIAGRHRLTPLGSQPGRPGHVLYRWRVDDGRSVAAVIGELAAERQIAAAQPNFKFALQNNVEPLHAGALQYAAIKLHLAEAHRISNGDNVLVALIDSQVEASHPELDGALADRFDAIGGDPIPHIHGTAMAGAIAAHRSLVGVAPHVRLLAVRAFGRESASDGTTFAIIQGLEWAVAHGARVINMSFAGPFDPALQQAISRASKRGVVLVAAAGNAGPSAPPAYPGSDPRVIAVTATDIRDGLFGQANRGNYIAVAAPGVDIIAAAPNGTFQLTTGTSVAAAHVSGIAALLIGRNPSLDPTKVRGILTATAKHVGNSTPDAGYGAGIADAGEAVAAVSAKSAAR